MKLTVESAEKIREQTVGKIRLAANFAKGKALSDDQINDLVAKSMGAETWGELIQEIENSPEKQIERNLDYASLMKNMINALTK